jgi:tetratricopeptide (TPR) repeat protein
VLKQFEDINKVVSTNLCVIYNKQKEWEKCIESANDALRIDNKHVKALMLKGKAMLSSQFYEEAIKLFTRALEFDPDNKEC